MIDRSKQANTAELKRFRVNGNVWIAADEMPTGVDVPMAWRELLIAPDHALAGRLMRMWAGVADRLPAVAEFFHKTLMRPAVFEREGGDIVLLDPDSIACDELNFFIGYPLTDGNAWPP
ncbi:hypothetical protein [Burkholderia stabilis]|uniref:Uncharacterized protein n=1 Tax=Burkholderia stabilis TaxID=95485 RepID=A0A1Y1BRS7_9BURK|nr:hypothetical protein [Burkholderia stabilis]BAX61038.1 hypothetical protein BSFP_039040 [Burkholderia stabilis]